MRSRCRLGRALARSFRLLEFGAFMAITFTSTSARSQGVASSSDSCQFSIRDDSSIRPALRQALELLRSLPKKFIKQITKPCLEYVHFPRGDGDAFRPIIGNGPSRKIVLGRSPDPLAAHMQIVVQVYRLLRTGFGRGTAHVYSITPRTILANSQYCSGTRTGKFLSLPGSARLLPLSGILAPGRTSGSQSRPQAAKRWRDAPALTGWSWSGAFNL